MDEGREGLSLQGLAERMEALERENAELRDEVAALKSPATRTEGPDGTEAHDDVVEGRVSRRAMLTKAGAAVAAVAAGTLLCPREAKAAQLVGDGSPGVRGFGTSPGTSGVTGQLQDGVAAGYGVIGGGRGTGYADVFGANTAGMGVKGYGYTGVYGQSISSDGYGGMFEGSLAPLLLVPKGVKGLPRAASIRRARSTWTPTRAYSCAPEAGHLGHGGR